MRSMGDEHVSEGVTDDVHDGLEMFEGVDAEQLFAELTIVRSVLTGTRSSNHLDSRVQPF